MNVCFVSYRAFPDGRAERPFLESDPANIAYALGGTYLSFYTLKKLSDRQLVERLRSFDLVMVALDVEAIELVKRIIDSCPGRAATYSEGHVADYQRLSPAGQISFVGSVRSAAINFLYWEKYIPFYQTLTDTPVVYLPYPYLLDFARRTAVPLSQRPSVIALPSGFAGSSRNGLASLTVAKRLLDSENVDRVMCWIEALSYEEDCLAVRQFILSEPFVRLKRRWNWRRWLLASQFDYRPLLALRDKFRRSRSHRDKSNSASSGLTLKAPVTKSDRLSLFRRTGWARYLPQLAHARVLIDLNNRETVGRNALDCAALGIACVSTDHSDMQGRLFPETTLTHSWDIDAAVNRCIRLLHDADYFDQVVTNAAEQVTQFGVDQFRDRMSGILDSYLPPKGL